MGSKQAILPFLRRVFSGIEFRTCLDAFSGSAAVSYLLKAMGKAVVANDFLRFCYHTANGFVANGRERLATETVDRILSPHQSPGSFIASTFAGLYFTEDENRLLDHATAQIRDMPPGYCQSMAYAALVRACLKRRPRGIFTYTGKRYDDGRRDLRLSIAQHFRQAVERINDAVFDNGYQCFASNRDVFSLSGEQRFDLVYLDPPYVSPHSDNDYTRRYHFVEGLVRGWEGLELQPRTRTRKFRRIPSAFDTKDTIYGAFERLFERFRDSAIVVSYSSNGLPTKSELVDILQRYTRVRVQVFEQPHRYSFGNQGHKVGDNQNEVREFVFLGGRTVQ
jgi:DNA adenine methylase